MGTTNKIRSTTEFANRMKALGLTYVEFAQISGYSLGRIYHISGSEEPISNPLNAFLRFLETLKEMGQLEPAIKKLLEDYKGLE